AFGTMSLAFAGLLTHFVPMLREAGVDAPTAGKIAGAIGASVIVSRLVVGWLADRLEAPRIAVACCGLCALGCLALAWQGAAFAWIGAVALGTAMGAEADLIGYLTARYFGIAHSGRLYAVQYAGCMRSGGGTPPGVAGGRVVADRGGLPRDGKGGGGGPDRVSHRPLFRHRPVRTALCGPVCELHADGRCQPAVDRRAGRCHGWLQGRAPGHGIRA